MKAENKAPMSREKVMERIRLLLYRAQDPSNEHEAALAAEMARRLLEKYNLAIGEVELEAQESVEVRVSCAAKLARYFTCLLNTCDFLFDTSHIQTGPPLEWRGGNYSIAICGLPQNVDASVLALKYFIEAIRSLARERAALLVKKGKRSERANCRRVESYRFGAAVRIFEESEKLKNTAREDARRKAIVKIGTAIARRHIDKQYPHRREVNPYGARKQMAAASSGL